MFTMNPPSNDDDVIDSRDIIQRIAALEASDCSAESEGASTEDGCGDDDCPSCYREAQDELKTLRELAEQASSSADWAYGETLIRDSYFEDYARDFAESIGAVSDQDSWPATCIDWERAARELQADYFDVEFGGVTYWLR